MNNDCIFCKIIQKTIPTTPVMENDDLIVIRDINPKAPTHLLIISKKHIRDVASLQNNDLTLAGSLLLAARDLSEQHGGQAFRLIANTGAGAGQSVFHLHMHYLAGKTMSDF